MRWRGERVLITGGASFIGGHLVDELLALGAEVVVADDFSSGRTENLPALRPVAKGWCGDSMVVYKGDLAEFAFARRVMAGVKVVFHLAAAHGGRGYIDTHPAECCGNMALDQSVLKAAVAAQVERICMASSACVYPSFLQTGDRQGYRLRESDADTSTRDHALPDLEYGWAKLMGEMSLQAYRKEYGLKGCAARIFTAYGPRENESHAMIALIAKALLRQDPYEVWGDGKQTRNFTYVSDIVRGLIRCCEMVEDGSAVNVGREDWIAIDDVVELIFRTVGWRPSRIEHDLSKPSGVAARAADLSVARGLLGWEPRIGYAEGVARTVEWYKSSRDLGVVARELDQRLFSR